MEIIYLFVNLYGDENAILFIIFQWKFFIEMKILWSILEIFFEETSYLNLILLS